MRGYLLLRPAITALTAPTASYRVAGMSAGRRGAIAA
jgi:hypothetical protein